MPRMPVPPVATACVLGLALLAQATPARAELRAWAIDPVHTRVLFAVSHAGFSKALGTVPGSTGGLLFDPEHPWQDARLEVTVPLARLELGDPDWNEATTGLLDVGDHPTAHFMSAHVYPAGPARATVCGRLTLHGVTRPLCMDVTINAVERHPMPPFRRTAGFSATATLSRSAFGVDAWSSMIGDTVELRIEAEAVPDDAAAVLFQPDPPPAPRPGNPPVQ